MLKLSSSPARSHLAAVLKAPQRDMARVLDQRMLQQLCGPDGQRLLFKQISRGEEANSSNTPAVGRLRKQARELLVRPDVQMRVRNATQRSTDPRWPLPLIGAAAVLGSPEAQRSLRSLYPHPHLGTAARSITRHLPALQEIANLGYSMEHCTAARRWIMGTTFMMAQQLDAQHDVLATTLGVQAFVDGPGEALLTLRYLLPCPEESQEHEAYFGVYYHDMIRSALSGLYVTQSAITILYEQGFDIASKEAFLRNSLCPNTDNRLLHAIREELMPYMLAGTREDILTRILPGYWPTLKHGNAAVNTLRLVCRELMTNALKYSDPAKSARWVKWTYDKAHEAIVVTDNGIGITNTEAIFTRSVREHPDHAPGEGIGLWSMRERMRQLGGDLTAASSPEGHSIFRVIIPPELIDKT